MREELETWISHSTDANLIFWLQVQGFPGSIRTLKQRQFAIILTCGFWETFVKDVCRETVEAIIECAQRQGTLGDYLQKVLMPIVENQVKRLNAPKSANVRELFRTVLGISDIAKEAWSLHKDISLKSLDEFVELRGSIAHKGERHVTESQVREFVRIVTQLADHTDHFLRERVAKIAQLDRPANR